MTRTRAWVLLFFGMSSACAAAPSAPPAAPTPTSTSAAAPAEGTVPSADGVPLYFRTAGRGSMAGTIVVEAAVEMPGRVVGLIPVDTLLDVGQAEAPAELTKLFDPPTGEIAPRPSEVPGELRSEEV